MSRITWAICAVLLSGCGPYAIEAAPLEHKAPTLVTRPCDVTLLAPQTGVGGHCDMSPYDGDVNDQYFELRSNAKGVPVRAAISRKTPQNEVLNVGGPVAVWDWEHFCDHWSGILTWSDRVFHDEEFTWITYHDWEVALDVTCDGDGYRIAGTWSGID
jgi:hypothetical protein